jgi:hypothetical protein
MVWDNFKELNVYLMILIYKVYVLIIWDVLKLVMVCNHLKNYNNYVIKDFIGGNEI